MAKVPDLFEDLKNCYSENAEYSSSIEHLSLNQKSFYDSSYDPLQEDCMGQFMTLNTSETSKISTLTFKESVVVTVNGKILKKRRLSFSQPITDEDLKVIASDPVEELVVPRSASSLSRSNVKYTFMRIIKREFTLNDALHQAVTKSDQFLKAAALTNPNHAVKFDMGAYKSADDSNLPVTLRISKTRLYVSAQNEGEPVLLQEMSEIPKTITDGQINLLFFWESNGTKSYFKSVANPELLIATKQNDIVHMARGQPSITDFDILEN
ncbi:interleukin-1 alpha [Tupaia chinensis]|uniref:Interleukin-1 n=1 Tax=Tupaia chinensis TaxID=246437 RepID=L9JMH4_TUPCH|nr:interleukin-1 alpha [Tupaia chinensis]ELW51474.1 Interleukin-1 alpha [Tupaia chinensis]